MGTRFVLEQPANSAPLNSSPVRTNLNALYEGDMGLLRPYAATPPDMTVLVGSDYSKAYVQGHAPMNYAGGTSPVLTAPSGNNRLSLLTIDKAGTLAWSNGSEATSPVEPVFPAGKLPICVVWCRVGMTSIKNTDDTVNGYIYLDRRPVLNLGGATAIDKTPGDFTVGNTAVETQVFNLTVIGGSLSTTNMVRLTFVGHVSLVAAATVAIRLQYGGSTFFTKTLTANGAGAISAQPFKFVFELMADNSASAQLATGHLFLIPKAANPALWDEGQSWTIGMGTAAINSVANQFLTVTAQFGGANASNTITMQYAIAELIT
jgi:hypothetical protein